MRQAHFKNIRQVIVDHIRTARNEIFIAVAWFTDYDIFFELCNKAREGVHVELLISNDDINNQLPTFSHLELETYGGKVSFITPDLSGAIMHHKFCVIDESTVITGSYNWSKRAQVNNENIIIISGDPQLAKDYKDEFELIKLSNLPTQSNTESDAHENEIPIPKNEEKQPLIPCSLKSNPNKYGYCTPDLKKIIIPCEFEYAYPFHGKIAKVLYNGQVNYITLNGYFIQHNKNNSWNNVTFGTGLQPAKASRELNPLSTEKICGYIDIESDEIIKIDFEYTEVRGFIGGFAVVKKGGKWGVIDMEGNAKIDFVYEWLKGFVQGLFIAKKNNKWGIINHENKEVLSIIYDFYNYSENEPYHTLSKDGKFGFYDFSSNKFFGLNYEGASLFTEGCAPVKINGKWGFINKDFEKLISFEFDGAKSFAEGVAAVKKGDKWGYINKKGELILPYQYRAAGAFHNSLAQVEYPLTLKQRFQKFINGRYERVLHRINTKGQSVSSWRDVIESKKNEFQ